MFTGDESGNWLYRALYKAGFANQPTSVRRNDGLKLRDCYITATCRCAPPQNKLLPKEISNCRPYLLKEIGLLKNVLVVIGLGRIGFDAALNAYREAGKIQFTRRPMFSHCVAHRFGRLTFIASYHPSQQNTFTGKLTEAMLDKVFTSARRFLSNR
jgi:uracil-DNA glycosylase family 4